MGRESNKNKTEKTCFVIMPISDHPNYPKGHFTNIYEQIFKPAIAEAGFIPKRVDEDNISSDIMTKILEGVTTSEMAICDLSSRNPNVMYELGLRHAYGKPVVLICDEKTDRIFDVAGINTVSYKSERLYEDVIAAREDVKEAIISTAKNPHSILKIAEVQAAKPNENDNMNDADYLKIMLMSIRNEIESIKQTNASMAVTDDLIYNRDQVDYLKRELSYIDNILTNGDKVSKKELMFNMDRLEIFKKELRMSVGIPKDMRRTLSMQIAVLEKKINDTLNVNE